VLVHRGRCQKHAKQADAYRGSSAARGYGSRWARYRAAFLREYPLCGDRPPTARQTNDSVCQREGIMTGATVVDHIVPVTGPTDPTFYADQKQALCATCHQAKRQRESQG
jgi:5-methylcytosine-specific restriction protein A